MKVPTNSHDLSVELKRLHAILKSCTYKQMTGLKCVDLPPYGVRVQVMVQRVDHETGLETVLSGPHALIECGESEDVVVMEVYKLWQWWEQHECAEHFHYQGARVYDPHEPGRNR